MAKVMICDDAAFMRMMIKDILTKNGYEIAAEAENGQKAVEKYPEAKVVGNAKTFNMIPQFFTFDLEGRKVVVKEGDT